MMLYLKYIFASWLLLLGATNLMQFETIGFMQNVNLIFHEAGHVLFIFFGDFFYTLGGTIFELGVPLLVTLHFLRQQQIFSAGFGAWWLSNAFMSVSIYASDAQERALPLITRDPNSHDWWHLLRDLGWLQYDDVVGSAFYVGAFLSLIIAAYFFWQDFQNEKVTSVR